jgi:hypothetical protein
MILEVIHGRTADKASGSGDENGSHSWVVIRT